MTTKKAVPLSEVKWKAASKCIKVEYIIFNGQLFFPCEKEKRSKIDSKKDTSKVVLLDSKKKRR
jgi:hypothetical protein